MKWLLRIAAAVALLLAVLAIVPFFISLDDYVPELEKALSARLERPVSIDKVDASLYPLPHATLDGITIGEAHDIQVRTVTVKPAFWSLFGENKVIRTLEFEDVQLTREALAGLIALTRRKDEKREGGLRIEQVQLREATVKLEKGQFGPFHATADIPGKEGEAGNLILETDDGNLQARLKPQGENIVIEVDAKSWRSPFGPPIVFDALQIRGEATRTQAQLKMVSAKLYGGTVAGSAVVEWGKATTLKGELTIRQVELKDAAALVSPKLRVSGRLDAKPVFSSNAKEAGGLDDNLRLETPFTVHDGVLYGVDLPQTALALLGQRPDGGETRFDELTGRLNVEGDAYRFNDLRMASGSMAAEGHLAITPARVLSGELRTSIAALGTKARIPLIVAGTLDSPTIYPNPRALAGAAAGTALLGPGLGTAAGAKLGEMVEELLGKKLKR